MLTVHKQMAAVSSRVHQGTSAKGVLANGKHEIALRNGRSCAAYIDAPGLADLANAADISHRRKEEQLCSGLAPRCYSSMKTAHSCNVCGGVQDAFTMRHEYPALTLTYTIPQNKELTPVSDLQ